MRDAPAKRQLPPGIRRTAIRAQAHLHVWNWTYFRPLIEQRGTLYERFGINTRAVKSKGQCEE
jgi:hypothetical protein